MAIYTSAYSAGSPLAGRQAQSLAYSTDGGATWTKYAGNPVLDRASADFRDPKVFWYDGDAGSYWVMVAVEALEREAGPLQVRRPQGLGVPQHLRPGERHRAECGNARICLSFR